MSLYTVSSGVSYKWVVVYILKFEAALILSNDYLHLYDDNLGFF